MADDEDQNSSETKLVGRLGARQGAGARPGGGGGGRPDELDASPMGLFRDPKVSLLLLLLLPDNTTSNESA